MIFFSNIKEGRGRSGCRHRVRSHSKLNVETNVEPRPGSLVERSGQPARATHAIPATEEEAPRQVRKVGLIPSLLPGVLARFPETLGWVPSGDQTPRGVTEAPHPNTWRGALVIDAAPQRRQWQLEVTARSEAGPPPAHCMGLRPLRDRYLVTPEWVFTDEECREEAYDH